MTDQEELYAHMYRDLEAEARAIYEALYKHPERMYAMVLDAGRGAMDGIPIPFDKVSPYLKERLEFLKAQMEALREKFPADPEPMIAPMP